MRSKAWFLQTSESWSLQCRIVRPSCTIQCPHRTITAGVDRAPILTLLGIRDLARSRSKFQHWNCIYKPKIFQISKILAEQHLQHLQHREAQKLYLIAVKEQWRHWILLAQASSKKSRPSATNCGDEIMAPRDKRWTNIPAHSSEAEVQESLHHSEWRVIRNACTSQSQDIDTLFSITNRSHMHLHISVWLGCDHMSTIHYSSISNIYKYFFHVLQPPAVTDQAWGLQEWKGTLMEAVPRWDGEGIAQT